MNEARSIFAPAKSAPRASTPLNRASTSRAPARRARSKLDFDERGALEIEPGPVGAVEAAREELGAGEPDVLHRAALEATGERARAAEIHAVEVRVAEIRQAELRRAEVGALERGAAEIDLGELRAGQVRAAEIEPAEVHPGEAHLGERGAGGDPGEELVDGDHRSRRLRTTCFFCASLRVKPLPRTSTSFAS